MHCSCMLSLCLTACAGMQESLEFQALLPDTELQMPFLWELLSLLPCSA